MIMQSGSNEYFHETASGGNDAGREAKDAASGLQGNVAADLSAPEKRSSQRHRVLKGGNIYFNRGYGAFSCTVKNLSDGGAMVLMEDSSGLPGEFDFVITGEDKTRKASISWRSNGRAGIVFH